jgi:hypothetical protein
MLYNNTHLPLFFSQIPPPNRSTSKKSAAKAKVIHVPVPVVEHMQPLVHQESEEELEPNQSSKRRSRRPPPSPTRVTPYTTSSNIGANLPSPPRSPPPGRPRAHPEVTYANFENDAHWKEDKLDVC